MKHLKILFLATGCFILFQNFQVVDLEFTKKYEVNEISRRLHAKEVLGKKYHRSEAAKFGEVNPSAGDSLLNVEIFNLVQNSLSPRHIKKATVITKTILEQSQKYDVDPVFIASIIQAESSFNPLAKGTSGEIGLMQLMPSTASYIAKKAKLKFKGPETLRDPVMNIKLGVAYFSYLRSIFDKKSSKYIAAYNLGPGKVIKAESQKQVPRFYSDRVLKYYEKFYKRIQLTQSFKNPFTA